MALVLIPAYNQAWLWFLGSVPWFFPHLEVNVPNPNAWIRVNVGGFYPNSEFLSPGSNWRALDAPLDSGGLGV